MRKNHTFEASVARFWSHVDKSGDCWLWTGALTKGYGQVTFMKRRTYAHRISYELENGEIPEGLFVCHTCDTPRCVRSSHLFLGTALDNNMDRVRKGRHVSSPMYGQNNPIAKEAKIPIQEIISRYRAGESCYMIAPSAGVSKSTVYNIVSGQHWSTRNGI